MQINQHAASRLKRSDKMHIVFRTDKQVEYVVRSAHSKCQVTDNDLNNYLHNSKTLEIWEGETKVLIIYNGG